MLKSEKFTTPFAASTRFVPVSVPPPGFVPMAILMESANDDTVLPN